MLIAARRLVSFVGVVGAVCLLGAASASANPRSMEDVRDESEPTSPTGNDCSKGCIECQKDCHESRCMASCTMQWSGCCMTAGMKPPVAGSCACLSN